MTRSSQQPPASQQASASSEARTESGAESEEAAAAKSSASAAAAVPAPPVVPDTTAELEAATAPKAQTPEAKAPEAQTSEAKAPEAQTPEAQAPGARASAPEADADTDPGASAAAQSRLPALVRTMTATAIDKPQQAGPVGRPGKAMLAGAAVTGALLVSVPFLVLAGNDDKGPEQPSTAAAGTVLDGSGPEAPGEFAVTAPETSSPAEGEDAKGNGGKGEKADQPVRLVPPPAAPPSGSGGEEAKKKEAAPDDAAKKADTPKSKPTAEAKAKPKAAKDSGGAKNQPAKAAPAVTLSSPVSFRSHLSGRCLDVPGHNFNDGQPLFMWDCNGADAQKWRFASDGTIRARDKCLDVANANSNNGSRIQLAWCNGSAAQKFTLNGAHDLVNTVVGKCVDIPNHSKSRGPSTYLILWECTGNDNQKWST